MAERIDDIFLTVQSALVGEYSLERELGRGGMGVVYLAREVALDRLVAIKVLPPQLAENQDLRARFVRESQTAARLSHPNIVPIFRVGEARDFVYFAMAYVEGETLTQRVRSRGPLAPPEGMRILREAAWALAYAHARGIVHRDVKPDNILLESGSGRAMLTDFGIAHVETQASASVTETGLILGTAHYMSPEQAAGDRLDGRSDLYALGLVAHFVFAGRVPFDAPSSAAILAQQLTQPAPPLLSVASAVPRKAGEAIDRCLAKAPDERFATGEALAEALSAATELPNEIPAPIRVWIAKGERGRAGSVLATIWLSGGVFIPLLARGGSVLLALGPVALVATIFGLPMLFRTRQVLRAGYTLDDLRGALRAHWMRRREELAYEHVESAKWARYTLWTVAGAGWATMVGALTLGAGTAGAEGFAALGGMVGGVTTLLGVIDLARRRFVNKAGSWVLKLWNSRFAERIVKLARVGLKNVALAPAAPQLTEVALGRATDALFQALPAAVQRDLKDLPATVRSLESDAQKLRAQIEQLERSLADLGARPGQPAASVSGDAGGAVRAVADERQRVVEELTATRDLAKGRLGASVAALENIRLGLMRLRMGGAPVTSVTTAIEAARRVAEDVERAVAADSEVDALLKRRRP